jgi:hypothetical protein
MFKPMFEPMFKPMCKPMFKPAIHALAWTALACAGLAMPAAADSQARIVRLSDVQGGVQINKNAGFGFENAFLNLPVTQGTQLRTQSNGRAEVEFEDGSTLRIAPNTTVEFNTLGLNDDGKRISEVSLAEGRAYVNWLGKSNDEFALKFSQEKIALSHAAHFRVSASPNTLEVASFKNDLEVESPSGNVKVDKKKMVAFDSNQSDQPTAAKNIKEDTYDEWDKQSVSYHDEYARNNSTPYGYGYSDLNYYGSFTTLPGFGRMWQPYFSGIGWNPFMDGAWAFYPGMGYTWASAYPWGWMPYYYGNWAYAPGFGWGWQPGGWSGWHGGLHYAGAAPPVQIPVEPKGTLSTVIVGKGGPILTHAAPMHTAITSGSAGLGIERGSLSSMRELNKQVAKRGSVALQSPPQFAASSARGRFGDSGERPPGGSVAAHATSSAPVGHASTGGAGHH